jgi:hypothetical protein
MRVVQKDSIAAASRQYTTIQAAVNNCATMVGLSATKRCLVKIMVGTWDVTTPVVTKPYVDIEGSGDGTIIRSALPVDVDLESGVAPAQATFIVAANSNVRISNLRVENNAPSAPGVALLVLGTARLDGVSAVATTGGAAEGFPISAGIAVTGTSAQGVELTGVTAGAVSTGAFNRARGIFVTGGVGGVVIARTKATATGPVQAMGVAVQGQDGTTTTVEIRDCVLDSTVSGAGYASALEVWSGATAAVAGSKIVAHDSPEGDCFGVYGDAQITASEVRTYGCLTGFAAGNAKIVSSLIQGPVKPLARVTNCGDEDFDPIPNQ